IALLENNRELRCCPAACHSHESGNPRQFTGCRIESGMTYQGAVTVIIDYVFAVRQTLNVIVSTPRRISFRQKFREVL
ncbi:MAG: hypothetical protein ACPL7J_10730, partial [Desulfomonilaceae bacterium]